MEGKKVNKMDEIEKMQYRNLRNGFHLLVKTILGEDYYNLAMDNYHCDLLCCADIVDAYNAKFFKKVKNPFTYEKCEEIIDSSIREVEERISKK